MFVEFTPDEYQRAHVILDLLKEIDTDEKNELAAAYKEYPVLDDAPPEWTARRKATKKAFIQRWEETRATYREVYQGAEERTMQELGGDPARILQHAKDQIDKTIQITVGNYQNDIANTKMLTFSARDVIALGGDKWALDPVITKEEVYSNINRHLEALEGTITLTGELPTDQLHAYIESTINNNPYIAKPGQGTLGGTVTIQRDLLSIGIKLPENIYRQLDRTAETAFKGKLSEIPSPIRMEKPGEKEITAWVSLSGVDLIKGAENLCPFDDLIHGAVISLKEEGNTYVSEGAIYKAATRNKKGRITKGWSDKIYKSLKKMGATWVHIASSDFLKAYPNSGWPEGRPLFEDTILHVIPEPELLINGKLSPGYRIEGTGYYDFSKKLGHTNKTLLALLETPNLNKTMENALIQAYLEKRIIQMQRSPRLSKKILYSTLFDEVGMTPAATPGASRVQKAKTRKHIKIILDDFITTGLIFSYKETQERRNFTGIELVLAK